jgi:hypothetical protein
LQCRHTAAHAVTAALETNRSAVVQAGETHAAATHQAGQAEAQRAQTQTAAQRGRIQQAGGGFGGDDKGRAQGQAAHEVASKGVTALDPPAGAIAADARSASAAAASRLTATAQRVSVQLGAQVQPATTAVRQPASQFSSAVGQLRGAVTSQLDRIRDSMLGGLDARQREAERGFATHARTASAQIDQQSHAGQGQVRRAVREAVGALRARTTALLQQAQRTRDPHVPAALRQAQQSLAGGQSQFFGMLRQGIAVFGTHLEGQLGTVRGRFAQAAQQVQAAAGQLGGQARVAQQEVSTRAASHAQQGTAQTQTAITTAATATTAQAAQIADRTTAGLGQAATRAHGAVQQQVTTATQQNADRIGGQVDTGVQWAAAQVAQDHEGFFASLVSAIGNVLSGIWDAVAAVAKAVGSVVLDAFIYVAGVVLQIVSDQLGGLLDPLLDYVPSGAFHAGRDLGDKIAFVLAIVEIIAGIIAIIGAIGVTGGFALVSVGTGGVALVATPIVITVDGTLVVVGGVLIAAGILMMASSGTPGNNQAQNKQFRGAVREGERRIGRRLSKDEIRQVHDAISGRNYGYHEIVELIVDMFGS